MWPRYILKYTLKRYIGPQRQKTQVAAAWLIHPPHARPLHRPQAPPRWSPPPLAWCLRPSGGTRASWQRSPWRPPATLQVGGPRNTLPCSHPNLQARPPITHHRRKPKTATLPTHPPTNQPTTRRRRRRGRRPRPGHRHRRRRRQPPLQLHIGADRPVHRRQPVPRFRRGDHLRSRDRRARGVMRAGREAGAPRFGCVGEVVSFRAWLAAAAPARRLLSAGAGAGRGGGCANACQTTSSVRGLIAECRVTMHSWPLLVSIPPSLALLCAGVRVPNIVGAFKQFCIRTVVMNLPNSQGQHAWGVTGAAWQHGGVRNNSTEATSRPKTVTRRKNLSIIFSVHSILCIELLN
jgi:hypothetical protein